MAKNKNRSTVVDEIVQFIVNDSIVFFEGYGTEEWDAFIAVASEELLSPAIGWRIAGSKQVALIPDSVVEYFQAFEMLNAERNQKGITELLRIIAALNKDGIRPVVLKGFAGIISKLYPGVGYRVHVDIDLLVTPNEFVAAINTLKGCGYRSYSKQRETYFWSRSIDSMQEYPMMISDAAEFGIDLHRRTAIFMSNGEELDHSIRKNAISHMELGVSMYIPDPASSLIHAIGHAHVQDLDSVVGRLSSKYLLDCILMHERLVHAPESYTVQFKEMLETHKLKNEWRQLERFVSAVNANESLAGVASLKYKFGLRNPGLAMRASAVLRLIRIAFRRPERYWTVEFYKNLLDKVRSEKFPD